MDYYCSIMLGKEKRGEERLQMVYSSSVENGILKGGCFSGI